MSSLRRSLLLRFLPFSLALNLGVESALADESERVPRVLAIATEGQSTPPTDLPLVLTRELSGTARAPAVGPVRWLDLGGRPLAPGNKPSPGGIRLVGFEPGVYSLPLRQGPVPVVVVRAALLSAEDKLAARASPARAIPPELEFGMSSREPDEAVRLVIAGLPESLPSNLSVVALNGEQTYADSLRNVPLKSAPCPRQLSSKTEGIVCASSPAIRLVTDLAERRHPSISGRALLGEIGGRLIFELEGAEVLRVPILGPMALGPEDPGRHRVRLRASVLTTFKGGPPAVGADASEARAIVLDEVASASRMWGQCGISLGSFGEVEVRVVPPPELAMVTVGCGRGLPASGGTIRFLVEGKEVHLRTHEGETPASIAPRLATALRRQGISVRVFVNARAGDAALSSLDLVMTDRLGAPVEFEVPASGLTDDPSLDVCEGRLELSDGLEHFNDLDAATGTPEERYLLRSLSDDDPQTIELIVVPLFSGLGRIGESFIHTPGGSLEGALILDRTGVRAGARSFTLAHELGHILLDLPGHPDDFGVDTPSSLMDADAADSTIFGPRRLSLEDCRRAFLQSGEKAPVPLITDWPLPSSESSSKP